MSLTGNGSKSIRRQDVLEQKSIAIGLKKLVMAHKATVGDTGINFASLVTPTEMSSVGFVNPNATEILAAQLKFYRNNIRVVSSIKGLLMDYLSYDVASSSRINFTGFTAEDGEIFIITFDDNAKTGVQMVDAAPLNASGLLTVATTDFNVGTPFEVNKYPTTQIGAVLVFRNGEIQFRNPNNSTSGGNYQEVVASLGLGSVIRFNNAPVSVDDNIIVVGNGTYVYRPDGSVLAEIENLAGQIDAMIPDLAAATGNPESDYQTAPNNVDLKNFGDTVHALLTADVPILTDWVTYVPGTNVVTNVTSAGKWRRDGDSIECQVSLTFSGAPSAFSVMEVDLPAGLLVDTAKLADSSAGDMLVGEGNLFDPAGGTTRYNVKALYIDTNSVRVQYVIQVTGASTIVHIVNTTNTAPFSIASGTFMNVTFRLPISGWTATQTLREQLGL